MYYIIFQRSQESDLFNFTQTFFNKNYRYSIAMAEHTIIADENESVINSTIKIARFNTIPLEYPAFLNDATHRLILNSFVLVIQRTDTEIIDWLIGRGLSLLTEEEYYVILQ